MNKLVFAACLSLLLPWTSQAADLQMEGRVLMSEGDPAAASKKFAEAAKVNPFDAAALNNEAVAVAAQGDYERALYLLERAARMSPNRSDIVTNLTEMRKWVARYAPELKLKIDKSNPVINTYPDADIPPEPPALWKK